MNSDVQIRLLRAVHACMRPIARILLRSGITYRQFADIAKLAFVQEAFSEPERTGAKTNISRVAVQTGMSRKDVARVEASLGGTKARNLMAQPTIPVHRPACCMNGIPIRALWTRAAILRSCKSRVTIHPSPALLHMSPVMSRPLRSGQSCSALEQ